MLGGAASPNHTVIFGMDSHPTDGNGYSYVRKTGLAHGFTMNLSNQGAYALGKVVIDTRASNNRHVRMNPNATGPNFGGGFEIKSGGELQYYPTTATYSLFIGGDFVNNGTLINSGALTFGSHTGLSATPVHVPSTLAQTISGSGIFRNSSSFVTGQTNMVTINNTNAAGVF